MNIPKVGTEIVSIAKKAQSGIGKAVRQTGDFAVKNKKELIIGGSAALGGAMVTEGINLAVNHAQKGENLNAYA